MHAFDSRRSAADLRMRGAQSLSFPGGRAPLARATPCRDGVRERAVALASQGIMKISIVADAGDALTGIFGTGVLRKR